MADVAKYQLVSNGNNNNNNILSDSKSPFSIFRTRKTSSVLVYGVVLVFVVFTLFVAFNPSYNNSSPWVFNLFTLNSTSPPPSVDDQSSRSQFSSIFSNFFPELTQNPQNITVSQVPTSQNLTKTQVSSGDGDGFEQNCRDDTCNSKTENLVPSGSQNTTPTTSSTVSQVPPPVSNSSVQVSEYISNVSSSNKSTNVPVSGDISNRGSNKSTASNQSVVSPSRSQNTSASQVPVSNGPASYSNYSSKAQNGGENSNAQVQNQSKQSTNTPQVVQAPAKSNSGVGNLTQKGSGDEEKVVKEKAVASDMAASLSKKEGNQQGNRTVSGEGKKLRHEEKDLIASLVGCDLYDGEWVRDESYPLYNPGKCKYVDEQFDCVRNGRPDRDYEKYKWKPKGCTLPRLNGEEMLQFMRGKRLVFVGDSLNRNMWESLVCILRSAAKDKSKVYEAYGRHNFRTEASYIFVFKNYNFTVEFFVSPFLVQQWEFKHDNGKSMETLRLDLMARDSDRFKNADFVVFNTGHWWTHEKTSKGEGYYQEGSHVYQQLEVEEAFRRAITTWGRWVDANIDPRRTHILFRGYSESHFSGGQWNSGGGCNTEIEPIKNDTYLRAYPSKMKVFERVIKGMKTPVSYLNVTKMTDYRKDAHPSIYRHSNSATPPRFQDCSHWCLPGVPDSWNELLYAELLRKQYKDRLQKNKT